MKPIIFSCLAILLGNSLLSQKIAWQQERKLTWEDFKAVRNVAGTKTAAFAYTGISHTVTRSSNPDSYIKIDVETVFDPSQSWKKNENPGSYILQHEQLHFDIAEVFTRKIRKMVAEKVKKSGDYDRIFKKEYQTIYQQYRNFQEAYDRDTEHSVNRIKQDEYTARVIAMLQELKQY